MEGHAGARSLGFSISGWDRTAPLLPQCHCQIQEICPVILGLRVRTVPGCRKQNAFQGPAQGPA
jgi:hypothetical protein